MSIDSSKGTRRVLVAEDDPTIRHLVTSIVEKEGYNVVAVQDGREAFRILQKESDFAAAIFDMMMPHLQGLDLIRHMQTEKRLKCIPVILITSEENPKVMTDTLAAGATVFLPKPFTAAQLQTMLGMLVGKTGQ